tara:strand:+ start:309 stop:446 length:138 start_codon:yes stop_codon:yes gene_type:complete
MKHSEYFLLAANMFIVPLLPKRWLWLLSAINMTGFVLFVYLERLA